MSFSYGSLQAAIMLCTRTTPKAGTISTKTSAASPAIANHHFPRGVASRSTFAGTGKERHAAQSATLAQQCDNAPADVMANDMNLASDTSQPSTQPHTSFLNKIAAKFHKRSVFSLGVVNRARVVTSIG